jgi:hypothetical protein
MTSCFLEKKQRINDESTKFSFIYAVRHSCFYFLVSITVISTTLSRNLSSHPIPQCATLRNQFRSRNQFRAIPGTRLSHNIKGLHAVNRVPSSPCNSGIGRNSQEFRAIPINFVSIQFPEFRTGIRH